MGWLENVIIENKELENQRIEVTDKNALYFLGPHLTLRGCTVVLKVPARRLHILGAKFIGCTFEVKQELKNHQEWICAALEGCRFQGTLSGCDFGYWPEYGSEPGYQLGAIEDCDFSEARLDGCRFMGCDPSTLRLPRWPCFTFLEPVRRAAELRAAPWPALFGRVVMGDLHKDPPRTVAVTYHAPTVAKQMETTPEALRVVLEKLDGIVI
jgi:hypothetical protein